jgi:uncharacterized protein with FMN-binding domain
VTRAAIVTWAVAVLFAVTVGIWVVHSHRLRTRACAHSSHKACVAAKKAEDGAILMGVLGAVFIVMVGGVAVASARMRA